MARASTESEALLGLDARHNGRELQSTWSIFATVVLLLGIQFTWTIEMGYGTPFLLELGLKKSQISAVWLAGPLSGILIQPIAGSLSDATRSRFGKRRPWIVGCGTLLIIGLYSFAFCREIVHALMAGQKERIINYSVITVAIASIYFIDFAVNFVMACGRALIVDAIASEQQEIATAWGNRLIGIGNVIGYTTGYMNLEDTFPNLTQLQILVVFSTCVLALTIAITTYFTPERDSRTEKYNDTDDDADEETRNEDPTLQSIIEFIPAIIQRIWHLPPGIRRICTVQFAAWAAWFPFLFYTSAYVASLHPAPSSPEALRQASMALLYFALTTLASSILIPMVCLPFVDLATMWTGAHFLYGFLLLSTYYVDSVSSATIVIGVAGIAWSLQNWAPFALLGVELKRKDSPMASTGAILGIHNIYIAAPQFLSTGIASLVFKYGGQVSQDKDGKTTQMEGDIGTLFRLMAVFAFLAGYLSLRVRHSEA